MSSRPTRAHGSPFWHEVADAQRVPDGRIMCPLCDRVWPREFESELEMDRIVPKREGGKYEIENCQLTCPTCNKRKGEMSQAEGRAACLAARESTAYEIGKAQRLRTSRRWMSADPERAREIQNARRRTDNGRAKQRAYHDANREKRNAQSREYYRKRKHLREVG